MSEIVNDSDSGESTAFNLDWSQLDATGTTAGAPTVQANEDELSPVKIFAGGRVIGDYELIREIGRGGMGLVFEARQRSLNKRVAVKILPFSGAIDRRAIKRFQNEAWAAAQLEHNNIVPVYQVGEERGVHYYVMQYVDGGDLSDLIAALRNATVTRRRAKGPSTTQQELKSEVAGTERSGRASTRKSGWSKGETLASPLLLEKVARNGTTAIPKFIDSFVDSAIQIAEALQFAHEMGIVHRDIKPSNLLLDSEGVIHIADFGLAQFGEDQGFTATGALVGTYAYMSPEQAMGKKRVGVDQRSDIFSLGATLYELLTLRRAFTGESRQDLLRKVTFENPVLPRKVDRNIPVALETILIKAMAKSPADRYQSADQMAEDFRLFRKHQPIKAQKPTLSQHLIQWARANRHLAASAASTLLIALVSSLIIAVVFWNSWSATALALDSETKEKERVEQLLRKSDGLRLARDAALQLDSDPSLALLLGIESAKRHPGADANQMILAAKATGHEIRTLVAEMKVGHVAFNRDGSRLVSSGTRENYGNEARGAILWDVASGDRLHEFKDSETTTAITSCVYSPDNARILTTSSPLSATDDVEGKLVGRSPRLWEDVTYRALVTFKDAFLFETHPSLFDPSGRKIVLPSLGHSATIYDCIGGEPLVRLQGHEQRVVFTAFSPNGQLVVTVSEDNTVRIWDSTNGQQKFVFDVWKQGNRPPNRCQIESVRFRPDGRQLATGSKRNGVQLWDLTNGELIDTDHVAGTQTMFWPNEMYLSVFSPFAPTLQVRLTSAAEPLREYRPKNLIRTAVLSPNAKTIAIGRIDSNRVWLWGSSHQTATTSLPGHRDTINHMCFSPNSEILATASNDKTIKLWHVNNGHQRAVYANHINPRTADKVIDPAGKHVAFPMLDMVNTGFVHSPQSDRPPVEVAGRIWMPNHSSTRFVATDKDRLAVHDVQTGNIVRSTTNPFGRYTKADINLAGNRVIAFGTGDVIMLWLLDEDRRLPIKIGATGINDLKFTPDGQRFVSAGDDGIARVWDANTGSELASLRHDGRVTKLEFTADSKQLATVTSQSRITLWDLGTYQSETVIEPSDVSITNVWFNASGEHLVSFDRDNGTEVVVWDADSAEALYRYPLVGKCYVAMHPDQNEVLITSQQQGVAIWQYESNRRLPFTEQARAHGSYSPDGEQIYVCSDVPWQSPTANNEPLEVLPNVLERWSTSDLKRLERIELAPGHGREFLISGDQQVLSFAVRRNGIAVHEISTGNTVARVFGHQDAVSEVLLTPDGTKLVTAGRDGQIGVWTVVGGQRLRTIGHHDRPIVIARMIDNQRLVTADDKGLAVVSSIQTGEKLSEFALGPAVLETLDVDNGGRILLSLSKQQTIQFHNLETTQTQQIDLNEDQIAWAEFSPHDAKLLVIPAEARQLPPPQGNLVGQSNHHVLIAPLEGKQAINEIRFLSPVVTSHFVPNGTQIVTLTDNGKVTFSDAESGSQLQTIDLEGSVFLAAAVSPSGRWLAVHHGDSISVWRTKDRIKWFEVDTGALPAPIPWPAGTPQTLALNSFNPFVATEQQERLLVRKDSELFTLPLTEDFESETTPRPLTAEEQSRFMMMPAE